MICNYCNSHCIKKGVQSTGRQKYYCKLCKRYQQSEYVKKACAAGTDKMIVKLICNSAGIRNISRIMEISPTTVIARIKKMARAIVIPNVFFKGRKYEVDELKTYVGKKENEYWVCCTLERESGDIMSLSVGRRNKGTLKRALMPVILSEPKKIHSDKLKQYTTLIDRKIHNVRVYTINNIERRFLNFRTHLKRLGRKTICFSKTGYMLEAVTRIYLWNSSLNL